MKGISLITEATVFTSRCVFDFIGIIFIKIFLLLTLTTSALQAQTYRGVQIGLKPPREDVQGAIDLGAKLIRYQIYLDWDYAKIIDCPSYKGNARSYLDHLDRLLDFPVRWVLDLHVPIGGRFATDPVLKDRAKQACMIDLWREVAERYKDTQRILGYDLYNEPIGNHSEIADFMHAMRAAVRSVDKRKIVIVAPFQHSASHFDKVRHYADPNTWYGVHFYDPGNFTHAGVWSEGNPNYPTARWDIEFLHSKFQKVLTFKRKYPAAQIYVSEFGASIFTKPRARLAWYDDITRLLNGYNFHWTFHAWREANVWNTENQPNLIRLIKRRLRG